MIKQYFKQALQMLKENPLVNTISILGTALSIAMIMVLVLVFQINMAGYPPESYRNRMLYVGMTKAISDTHSNNRGHMSSQVAKECFYTLQKPEAVAVYAVDNWAVSIPGKRLFKEYRVKSTNAEFWKVFDFSFIKGYPYTDADFDSALPKAVITSRVALELFGSTDVIGETIIIDFINYTVTGVVIPKSEAAKHAYAEVWVPYTVSPILMSTNYNEGISGSLQVVILARNPSDFEDIRRELEQQRERYNAGKADYRVEFENGLLTRLDIAIGSDSWRKVELKDYLFETGALLLFLLLIPALNLTGVVQSSVQKRRSEIGLRKAFGATYGTLMMQVLYENLVITLIGGIIGLGLSFIFLFAGRNFLLSGNTLLTMDMLFKPGLFIAALVFALLLNLLSAGIPAIRTSRQPIVNALKDIE